MRKTIILLPLVCLIFCAAQNSESLEVQSLIFNHTPNLDAVQRISVSSSYLCPIGYVYLVLDFQVFNGVVCVETTITDTQLQTGDCSPGWAPITADEFSDNPQQYCSMLGSGVVARIGFMGSLSSGCSTSDWDLRGIITQTICVKREINDMKLIPSEDNVCGKGMVLVTQQEAQANQDAYCSLLDSNDIVRLADGGSMDGPAWSGGTGCKIRYGDRRDLGAALCRALLNSEPSENEEVFIPQAASNEAQLSVQTAEAEMVVDNNDGEGW